MLKRLLNKSSLLMLALLVGGVFTTASADTSTVTASKVASASESWAGSAGETWSVSVTDGATGQNVTNGYAQVGTSKSPSTSIAISTSGISGTITSIVVNCAAYQGKASISATVGGSAFGTQSQAVPSWSSNSGGEVTFTGSASGEIAITMTNGDGGRAMYIKSIAVTYSSASPTAPAVIVSEESLDFGNVIFGQTKDLDFAITPANLTGDLSLSCNNDNYVVSPKTIASTVTEAITITVTAKPTTIDDDMEGIITISGGGLTTNKTVTLTTTVTSREGVPAVGPSASTDGYYELVTDASSLAAGDKLIFVSGEYAMSTTQNSNNRSAASISINEGKAIITDDTQVVNLEGESGAWYFNVGDGKYLYAASKSWRIAHFARYF
ncbi:MAG: hypothetical protein IKR50_02010 [Prevotella sp.]|nr:hypothetical protein [Prevotella sp.]